MENDLSELRKLRLELAKAIVDFNEGKRRRIRMNKEGQTPGMKSYLTYETPENISNFAWALDILIQEGERKEKGDGNS